MNALLLLALLVLLVGGLLFLLKVRGPVLTLSLATLLFGATGYAMTGRPGLAASPIKTERAGEAPLSLQGARRAFYGRFNSVEYWATLAESYANRGKLREAAGVYGSAVREHPRNFALWSLYGNALVDHSGTLSPAASLAFDRAIDMSDGAPGPRFFKALAQIRVGDTDEGRAAMIALLEDTPETVSWRPLVAGAIAMADQSPTGS